MRHRGGGGEEEESTSLEDHCQRQEERIVELHSVIAELSRKLESREENVIREESDEFDEAAEDEVADGQEDVATDSCVEED